MNLSWNGLAYEGSLAISRLIDNNEYLQKLDISNNRINWEGATLIAEGLKHNGVLEVLKVRIEKVFRNSPFNVTNMLTNTQT